MSVVVTTQADAESARARRRRHRQRWLIIEIAMAMVIAAVVCLGVAAYRYQPLALCCSSALGAGSSNDLANGNAFSGSTQVTNALGTEFEVAAKPGSTVEMVFTIANTGARSVRLLGFGTNARFGPGVRITMLQSTASHGGYALPLVPATPATLRHGDQRLVVLAVTFPTLCPSGKAPGVNGGADGFGDLVVHYEYLGMRHTVDLPMGNAEYTIRTPPFCW